MMASFMKKHDDCPPVRSKSYGTLMDEDLSPTDISASECLLGGRMRPESDDWLEDVEENNVCDRYDNKDHSTALDGTENWITRSTPPLLCEDSHFPGEVLIYNGPENCEIREAARASNYSTKDKLVLAMLSVATFFGMVVFACIAPFFPEEAKRKGASETITGFVFGIFQLVIVIFSPIFGRYMPSIGSKTLYGTGLCVVAVTSILFGLLNLSPPGATFIGLAFALRIFEAIGDAAAFVSAFSIVAKTFPTRVATTIGIIETFTGAGFAAGPPIGGALYEIGGFQMPFMVLGSILFLCGVASFFFIPRQDDPPLRSKDGALHLIRTSPRIMLIMIFATLVASASISFLDPTLQPHLAEFNLSPLLVGLVFLIIGGVYALSAPLWGWLIDLRNCSKWVMMFGSVSSFISLLLIGPSPIFPFKKQLWLITVSEVFMGLGLSALYIPPFQQCLRTARESGYPDTLETYGLISGLIQSSFAFGSFLGPTLGGFAVEWIGFAWSTTALSLLHVICGALISCLVLDEYRQVTLKSKQRSASGSRSSVEYSPLPTRHKLK